MILPDAFTGAILAAEGVRDGVVLLNGPTGCKFHHGALTEALFPRAGSVDPLCSSELYYFGQPRVPCTYLQEEEYISGSASRLQEALRFVGGKGHSLITVINSPGAALIGDDLRRLVDEVRPPVPVAVVEGCGFSQSPGEGFQECLVRMLEALPPEMVETTSGINLLGVSMLDHGWDYGVSVLRDLLGLCKVRVGTVLSAGCTARELALSRSATLSVVMDEEFGGRVAKVLRNSFSVVRVSPGQPIGFRGTSNWLEQVCDALGVDPSPALEVVRKEERRCALLLARHSSLTGLPKGATFSLQARPSVALGLLEFLHGYLGMVPVCVDCHEKAPAVEGYLREHGLEDVLGASLFHQPCQLMMGDGNAVSMARSALGVPGIEIAPPYQRTSRIRRTTLWGHVGAVDLLDEVLLKLGDRW